MLEALLVYLGETQREGRVVTRRLRSVIILSVLAVIFFLIAFVAAVVAGSIYLARHVGAGPAALVVAGSAFLLGVIMLVALAILKRPRVYATRPVTPLAAAAPLTAAPLALQSLLSLAIQARPYATLAVAVAAGFLATRAGTKKDQVTSWLASDTNRASGPWMRGFFMLPAKDRLADGILRHAALI